MELPAPFPRRHRGPGALYGGAAVAYEARVVDSGRGGDGRGVRGGPPRGALAATQGELQRGVNCNAEDPEPARGHPNPRVLAPSLRPGRTRGPCLLPDGILKLRNLL